MKKLVYKVNLFIVSITYTSGNWSITVN